MLHTGLLARHGSRVLDRWVSRRVRRARSQREGSSTANDGISRRVSQGFSSARPPARRANFLYHYRHSIEVCTSLRNGEISPLAGCGMRRFAVVVIKQKVRTARLSLGSRECRTAPCETPPEIQSKIL